MRKTDAKTLKSCLPQWLREHGLPLHKPFACLNPAHQDAHPSMGYNEKNQTVHCFACGATYDIFDLVGQEENLTDFPSKMKAVNRRYGGGEIIRGTAKPPQPESFAAAFSESVRRAGMSAIQICMFITVFSVLSCYFLLAAGRFLPPEALPLVLGSLELSAGCAALADCALALQWKLCIASALLSFGGVSVLAQSRAAVQEHGLTGRLLLPCKALQAVLSCTLTLIAAPLFRGRLPIVRDRVTCISTPGQDVDVLVTQAGVAVNPKNTELRERLRAAGLPVVDIHELKERAERITGVPAPLPVSDRVVAKVISRDGELLDTIRQTDNRSGI